MEERERKRERERDGGQAGRKRRRRRRRRRTVRSDPDKRVRFCDGGFRLSSELRTDLIPSLPPECALRVASLRWGALSSFSPGFCSSSRLWMDEFGLRMQPYAKSTLPVLFTIFPSIFTATSLTANASQWAYFHTRLSSNVIHEQDKRLFSLMENEVVCCSSRKTKKLAALSATAAREQRRRTCASFQITKTRTLIANRWDFFSYLKYFFLE